MGDFNQIGSAMEDPMRRQAFQNFMMMPGGATGFGMPGAGRDQSFQDYMNKKMQEDAQRRAIEMQEKAMEDMRFRNSREFAERQGASRMIMDTRRMFPQMGAIPGSMY